MIVEAKLKSKIWGWGNTSWNPVSIGLKFNHFKFDDYSMRINKNKQYHRYDTKGAKEAYEKAMAWMILQND